MATGRVAGPRSWLPLLAVLAAQALLLFPRLDLLDIWGDELFTLNTVSHSLREIVPILQNDVHPPLYYFLLHEWVRLPLPWTRLSALRAFSGVMALLCTFLLDRFWLRRGRPAHRWPALALFAFSPCLLLYGRMARSYTMQTALGMAAIFLLWRWLGDPRRTLARALPACAAMVLLLYTHYLPGLAVLAAFTIVAWKRVGPMRVTAWAAASLAAYAPWLPTLARSLRAWESASGFRPHYQLTHSPVLEEAFKVAFGIISLTIGESFAPLALALVPLAVWMIWRGFRVRTSASSLLPLVAIAAAIGYIGASRWVSWPFVPARLLWLLPFVTLALAAGLARGPRLWRYSLTAAIFLSFVSSGIYYFRRENFVNMGYAAPLREIALRLKSGASSRDTVLADAYNTDFEALHYYLGNGMAYLPLRLENAIQSRAAARAPGVRAVWIVRNGRDISPGGVITSVAADACRGRTGWDTWYEPFPAWERAAMRIVSGSPAPQYFYRLTFCQ